MLAKKERLRTEQCSVVRNHTSAQGLITPPNAASRIERVGMTKGKGAAVNWPKMAIEPTSGALVRANPASEADEPLLGKPDAVSRIVPAKPSAEPRMKPDAEALPSGQFRARMDYVMEKVQADDATRTLRTILTPDPRRYEVIEKDGEPHYLDKYLRVIVSFTEIKENLAQSMLGMPIYMLRPTIDSAGQYAADRLVAVRSELAGGEYTPPTEKPSSQKDPHGHEGPLQLVFLSIDIIGATAQRKLNPADFERAYKVFMRELLTLVGQFHGGVIKATGDGFIACVDHPAFTTQCDNGVDLGLSLLRLLTKSINPALSEAGLPELNVRIGADYGMAEIRTVEVPTTGYSTKELASDALNRSVKIQETCGVNQLRIGRTLYELLHVKWLERAIEVDFDGALVGSPGYRVYEVC